MYDNLDSEKDIHKLDIYDRDYVVSRYKYPFYIKKHSICNPTNHLHEFIQINYIYKGKLKHVINGNSFEVHKGDIFVIPPYVPHSFSNEFNDHFEIIDIVFFPEFINESFSSITGISSYMDFAYLEPFLVSEKQIKPRFKLAGSLQTKVEDIFDEALKEYEKQENGFEVMIKALLLKVLVIVGREFKKDVENSESGILFERHRDALNNAIKYIDENYTRDLTIEETAKVALLSISYFRYLFKQITQKKFIEYINDLRIKKAIELLQNNKEMRIIDISEFIGYNNVNHFNRVFHQKTGLTPTEFKR